MAEASASRAFRDFLAVTQFARCSDLLEFSSQDKQAVKQYKTNSLFTKHHQTLVLKAKRTRNARFQNGESQGLQRLRNPSLRY